MNTFRKGERVVHPTFGAGKVLNIDAEGRLRIDFDNHDEKLIVAKYARLQRLTPAEEDLRKREEKEWLEMFCFETEDKKHHLGTHWSPFFDDALPMIKRLPEILPASLAQVACADNERLAQHPIPSHWPQGIHLAWPLRTHGLMMTLKTSANGPSEVKSLYPSVVTGSQHRLMIDRVVVWSGGLEAHIEGNIWDMPITFFDTLYCANRCFYEKSRLCEFILTGIAYSCRRAEDHVIEITNPSIVELLNRDIPENEKKDGIPVHTKGMAALIPLEEGDRDEYTFHGPVKAVEEITVLDQPGWICEVTVLRGMDPEMDIDLKILVTRRVWEEVEAPRIGEDIEGALWLQGYLWYPEAV